LLRINYTFFHSNGTATLQFRCSNVAVPLPENRGNPMNRYSVKKVAEMLGLDRTTVFRYIKQGKILAEREKKGAKEVYLVREIPWHLAKTKNLREEKRLISTQYERKEETTLSILSELRHIGETQSQMKKKLEKIEQTQEAIFAKLSLTYADNDTSLIQNIKCSKEAGSAGETPSRIAKNEKTKGQETKKEIDWASLRVWIKNAAEKRGGNRALARELGMSESAIRRFSKGEYQTLSDENLAKVKQALTNDEKKQGIETEIGSVYVSKREV
jgi:DNA-binding Xre family transcriptional regulator